MTCLGTNIFVILWNRHADARKAFQALEEARTAGKLSISSIVYAELLAYPSITQHSLEHFLDSTRVEVDQDLPFEVFRLAGERFADYAKRRRKQAGQPRRILADFLIGAHAVRQNARLLTFDRGRYGTDFPELKVIHP